MGAAGRMVPCAAAVAAGTAGTAAAEATAGGAAAAAAAAGSAAAAAGSAAAAEEAAAGEGVGDEENGGDGDGEASGGDGGTHRFVYAGVAGTWTPLHADILRSFSWSANVAGRKKWFLAGAYTHPLFSST